VAGSQAKKRSVIFSITLCENRRDATNFLVFSLFSSHSLRSPHSRPLIYSTLCIHYLPLYFKARLQLQLDCPLSTLHSDQSSRVNYSLLPGCRIDHNYHSLSVEDLHYKYLLPRRQVHHPLSVKVLTPRKQLLSSLLKSHTSLHSHPDLQRHPSQRMDYTLHRSPEEEVY